jgi:hypothetical protein
METNDTADHLVYDVAIPGHDYAHPTIRYDAESRKWIGELDGGVWSRAGTLRGAIRTARARYGSGATVTQRTAPDA